MKVVPPSIIDDSTLVRTNIAEDDALEYNPGTTYNIGDNAMLAASNKWYEALENGIIGISPDSDPIKWLDLGATRPWRMFDAIIGNPTIGNSVIPDEVETGISVDIITTNRIDSVSIFGLVANEVDVRLISQPELASDLTLYADQTAFLVDWTIGAGISFDAASDEVGYTASSNRASETIGVLIDQGSPTYYIVTLDVVVSSGSVAVQTFDGTYNDKLAITATGSYEVVINRDESTNDLLFFTGTAFTGTVKNISTKKLNYNRTFVTSNIISSPDWYLWYFEEIDETNILFIGDIPVSSIGDTLRVNIRKGGVDATVGELVVGKQVELGTSTHGASIGIKDYSRKDVDGFGNFIITERRFADIMSVDFVLFTRNLKRVKGALASLRAKPAVWVADEEYESTVIYGYYKSFDIIISGEDTSDASIDIEGLV